jgi:hypothetical protein
MYETTFFFIQKLGDKNKLIMQAKLKSEVVCFLLAFLSPLTF